MARKGFDISLLGDKALMKKFDKLQRGAQGKIIRPVIRASAKRAKQRVVENLSGAPVQVRTGKTLEAFQKAPIRSAKRDRDEVRIGQVLPDRDLLGISEDDPYYYPMALEYGHRRAPAYPFIRPAIDMHREKEIAQIGREIGQRMTVAAKKR